MEAANRWRGLLDDAVRCGVVENSGETLRLMARSIEDCERDAALLAFKAWMGYGWLG